MNLINEEDDLAIRTFDFFDDSFDALFKLAFKFGTGNQGRDVENIDLFGQQIFRNVLLYNAPGDPFDDGRFSNTGIPDEDRIIFFAARKDVQDPADFFISTDDRVELAIQSALVEMDAVFLEGIILVFGALIADFATAS